MLWRYHKLMLLAMLALSSCTQPELRGGASAAQFEQIKPLIRAETKARIPAVTMQHDGTIFVDTFDKCGYHLRRVKGLWQIDWERVHVEAD